MMIQPQLTKGFIQNTFRTFMSSTNKAEVLFLFVQLVSLTIRNK